MKQFWLVSALEYLMLISFIVLGLGLFVIFINSIVNLELTKKTIQESLKLNRAVSTFDLYGTFVLYLVMLANLAMYLK